MTIKHKYRTDSTGWIAYYSQPAADLSDPVDDMSWIDSPDRNLTGKNREIQSTPGSGKPYKAVKT